MRCSCSGDWQTGASSPTLRRKKIWTARAAARLAGPRGIDGSRREGCAAQLRAVTPPMPAAAAAGTPAAPTGRPRHCDAGAPLRLPRATPPVVPNALGSTRAPPKTWRVSRRNRFSPLVSPTTRCQAGFSSAMCRAPGDRPRRKGWTPRSISSARPVPSSTTSPRSRSTSNAAICGWRCGPGWRCRSDPQAATHLGRPIAIIESPPNFQAVRLIDLAISSNGAILVLDGAAPRHRARSGAKTLEELMSLDVAAPASIAAAGNERTAYVAHGMASSASTCAGEALRL